jgi:hypothetical protein
MSHDTQHWCITNGGIAEDAYNDTLLFVKAKLTLMNKSLHNFPEMLFTLPHVEMLYVNPQLVAEFDYDRDVLHDYIDHNLPRLNIC